MKMEISMCQFQPRAQKTAHIPTVWGGRELSVVRHEKNMSTLLQTEYGNMQHVGSSLHFKKLPNFSKTVISF